MSVLRCAAVLLAAAAVLSAASGAYAQAPRCGGFLQPPCPPPPPPPPPPPAPVAATVTLTPAQAARRIDTKRSLTFHGAVSGVDNPQGLFVELRQRVSGYGLSATLEPLLTQAGADGRFDFDVLPRIGVDVQAVIREDGRATGSSPVRRVTVRSTQNLSLRAVTSKRGRFVLTTVGPASVPLASGAIKARAGKASFGYLYLIAKNAKTGLRIGSGRIRDRACAAVCKRSAIGSFRITPALSRKRNFLACARGPMFIGVEDAAVSPDCGKKSIKLRGAT